MVTFIDDVKLKGAPLLTSQCLISVCPAMENVQSLVWPTQKPGPRISASY